MNDVYEKELLKLAKKAFNRNEIPVSALIVKDNKIIAKNYNKKNLKENPIYHAEILCIIQACKKLKRWNLSDCEMYVSLEPCDMCKQAIQEARISFVGYILPKGQITNKYKKTHYEQMYASEKDKYIDMLKTIFEKLRKQV